MIDVNKHRRQVFMYQELYENTRKELLKGLEIYSSYFIESPVGTDDSVVGMHAIYQRHHWIWMLDYTAGVEIPLLAQQLSTVVDYFVKWHEVAVPYLQSLNKDKLTPDEGDIPLHASPVNFTYNQIEYEDVLQLVSCALLLRDERSVHRIIHAMRFWRHTDCLYERLIAAYTNDGDETYELNFDQYEKLRDVFCEQDPEVCAKLLIDYTNTWYKFQDGARWHNAHREIENDTAWYYGYWAFEAGAAAYQMDIDDSGVDHLCYPRDLVQYAHKLYQEDKYTSKVNDPSQIGVVEYFPSVQGGEPVPKSGYWFTPAKENSRQYFNEGDIFPKYNELDWGVVHWQWDGEK